MQSGSPLENPSNDTEPESYDSEEVSETSPAKPVSDYYRPELTRLARLTLARRIVRRLVNSLARLAVRLCTRCQVAGLSNFPSHGPALVVTNHLGDADPVVAAALFPFQVEGLAKIDLVRDYPPLGWLMDSYGVIWVHRGRPDRRALRACIQGLRDGRIIAIAPEGRESLIGALERGTDGAAYLALKTGVPVTPVVFTGTENRRIFGGLRRLQRAPISMTVGASFDLRLHVYPQAEKGKRDVDGGDAPQPQGLNEKQSISHGTQVIMLALAKLLPPEYRGVYQKEIK
jgi:1-acyl-sn-glycerol-3-phosphate acyltransferase